MSVYEADLADPWPGLASTTCHFDDGRLCGRTIRKNDGIGRANRWSHCEPLPAGVTEHEATPPPPLRGVA